MTVLVVIILTGLGLLHLVNRRWIEGSLDLVLAALLALVGVWS